MKELETLAEAIALKEGVDPCLLKAIITVESSWKPFVVRFEPAWKYLYFPREHASRLGITEMTEVELQKMSWGLCQVMGSVIREHKFDRMLTEACDPSISITYGCRHIKRFISKYGEDAEASVIAAYNAGSARKTMGGMFVNQQYVDKVDKALRFYRRVIQA